MNLHQMVAGILQVQFSSVDFILNEILMCYGYSQMFELCHAFKGFVTCVYVL